MQTIAHKTVYVAQDGTNFDGREEAIAYERTCLVRNLLGVDSSVASTLVAKRKEVIKALNYDGRRAPGPRKPKVAAPEQLAAE